jgi:hypothetical protein
MNVDETGLCGTRITNDTDKVVERWKSKQRSKRSSRRGHHNPHAPPFKRAGLAGSVRFPLRAMRCRSWSVRAAMS